MQFFGVTLESRVCDFDQVNTFHFKSSGEPLSFEAGMYVHIRAPDGGGVRHMSFASAPEEGKISFSMDLASGSPFKQAMAALTPGAQVQLFKLKFKHFELIPEQHKKVVFLAGGLGITPIRSLLLSQRCRDIDWRLIHVARDGKHLYKEELLTRSARPQVRTDHAGAADAVAVAARENKGASYFVCGSARFVEGMQALLADGGISSDQIRMESFK